MNEGSYLGGLVAGAALWGATLLAIWAMADPAPPEETAETLAPAVTAEALRDNQRYVEQGLLATVQEALDEMETPDLAKPGMAIPLEPFRPAPALAGRILCRSGT